MDDVSQPYTELPLPAYTGPVRYSSSIEWVDDIPQYLKLRNIHAQPHMPGASLTYKAPQQPHSIDYMPAAVVALVLAGWLLYLKSRTPERG